MLGPRPPPLISNAALFVDVDGTLVDFMPSPREAIVTNETRSLLLRAHIALGGAVALVSGRSIEALDQMFVPLRLPAAGQHGQERRLADGSMSSAGISGTVLEPARHRLRKFLRRVPGVLLEEKAMGLALHFRRVPGAESKVVSEAISVAAELGDGVEIQLGSMVVELKAGRSNKASAVAAFMDESPFAGRTPIFIGDDLTDVGALEWVAAHAGIAVAVGTRVRAPYWLSDAGAVQAWLAEFVAAIEKDLSHDD